MYFLNIVFHVLHVGIIIFCLFAWLIPELLIAHLVLCLLTLTSWFVIGLLVKRPGLCVVTEIQQKIRTKLESAEPMENYVHFLFKRLTGKSFNVNKVDCLTQSLLYSSTALSIWLNLFS